MSAKILEVEKIEAETVELFIATFNERANELARFNPVVCPINSTSALIYHESIETEIEEESHYCCGDCPNYTVGQKCELTGERLRPLTKACNNFGIVCQGGN